MYGAPSDPTFITTYVRELRRQGKKCAGCRYNVQKPGDKYCEQGNKRWPHGPCVAWDEKNEEL